MRRVCGVDEAGRGPLAGPVVAAAVVFPDGYKNERFVDSKKLSATERVNRVEEIKNTSLGWAWVAVGHHRIDRLNILQATRLAMKLSVERVVADEALIDGNTSIDIAIPQQTIVKGDALHTCISAASIIAKVSRDNLMAVLAEKYPGFGLEKHAGYPTKAHKEAIQRLGPSRIHRKSFRGVKEHLQATYRKVA